MTTRRERRRILFPLVILVVLSLGPVPGHAQDKVASHLDADRTPSFMATAGTMQIVQSRYLDEHWNPGAQFAAGFSIPLTKSVALRSRFSYHRFHPDWEALPMGRSDWTNTMYFLSFEALAHPTPSVFGLAPYAFGGIAIYKENFPVTNFSAEGLWTVHVLQPDFQSGLGVTGGLGLRQNLSEHVSVIAEGSVRLGLSREHVYGFLSGGRQIRARGLLGISVGARYAL